MCSISSGAEYEYVVSTFCSAVAFDEDGRKNDKRLAVDPLVVVRPVNDLERRKLSLRECVDFSIFSAVLLLQSSWSSKAGFFRRNGSASTRVSRVNSCINFLALGELETIPHIDLPFVGGGSDPRSLLTDADLRR